MTISKDLFLSILAMDSYNQGYGRGIVHDKNQIGTASVSTDSEEVFRDPDADGLGRDRITSPPFVSSGAYPQTTRPMSSTLARQF